MPSLGPQALNRDVTESLESLWSPLDAGGRVVLSRCPAPPRPLGGSAVPIGRSADCRRHVLECPGRAPGRGRRGMDPQAASRQGSGVRSARELASAEAGFAAANLPAQETEIEMAMDRLATGTQSIPNDIPAHTGGPSLEEEGLAVEKEADGELYAWELSEGPPVEQAADLLTEDWDLELKADQGNPYDADDIQGSISQDLKPWVCCAPQGDMIYDPSWHHPPPLIPHYSKMVFETGQFDDAED
ncbi:coordinator of PRMT5 and differentiation stimulator [Sigmodon hispidus]